MSDTYTKTIASYLFLDLSWELLSQDITNNRSRVRLTLKLRQTGTGIWFSASKSGVLQGSSFTYTGGFSGSGTRILQTRDIWVNHNSNGTKSQTFSASFNPAFTYMGSSLGNQTVSGSATLPTIPRSSEVTAFSMGGALKPSTANTVSVRLNVYSSAFRFDVSLRYGSNTIASWNNQSFTHNTSKSLALTTSQVNDLLSAMKNTSSGTVNIRVRTKSGSGGSNIGSVQSRNATVTVDSTIRPTATGLSVNIDGTRRDNVRGIYVQGYSRVKVSFNESAKGGARVSSRNIVIRHNASKGNVSSINSTSGTSGVLSLSGVYEVIATVTDSRGRKNTQTRATFTVQAYSPPKITEFEATRNSSTPTTVNIRRYGGFTPIGTGHNTLTISVQRRQGTGDWANVVNNVTTASSTFGATVNSTGNSVTSSYEFRLVATDLFGGRAEATSTVSTQRVVLDIHKNEGVGIGKIHEDGVLDTDGDIYSNGRFLIVPHKDGSSKSDPIVIRSKDNNGHGYIEFWGADGNRKGILGIPTNTSEDMELRNELGGNTRVIAGRDYVNLSAPNIQANGTEIVARGSNSNGQWVRYYDGTQICWHHGWYVSGTIPNSAGSLFRSGNIPWTFPVEFASHVSVYGTSHNWAVWVTTNVRDHASASYIQWSHENRGRSTMSVMAIGRWN